MSAYIIKIMYKCSLYTVSFYKAQFNLAQGQKNETPSEN